MTDYPLGTAPRTYEKEEAFCLVHFIFNLCETKKTK